MWSFPTYGAITRKVSIIKFCKAFSGILESGFPILEGMRIIAPISGNKVLEKAIIKAEKFMSEGDTISDSFMKTKVFPPELINVLSVGENTGNLDVKLNSIVQHYEDELKGIPYLPFTIHPC